MKRFSKKITALLLGFTILIGCFGTIVFAAEPTSVALDYVAAKGVDKANPDTVMSDFHMTMSKLDQKMVYFQFDLSSLPEDVNITGAMFRTFYGAVGGSTAIYTFDCETPLTAITYNELETAGYTNSTRTLVVQKPTATGFTAETAVPTNGSSAVTRLTVEGAEITASVKAAYDTGKKYYNLVFVGAGNDFAGLSFTNKATYQPGQQLIIEYSTEPVVQVNAPTVEITEPTAGKRIKAGTSFNVIADLTLGTNELAAENPVTITVEPAVQGLTVTPVSIENGNYVWNLSGIPQGNYSIKVTATDENGLEGFDTVSIESLGSQQTSLGLVSDANGYEYNWQIMSVVPVAFQYDLSQLPEGTISKVIWNFTTTSKIPTQLEFKKITVQEPFGLKVLNAPDALPKHESLPFYETTELVSDGLKEETWDGETADFFSVDLTDAVLEAIRNGERYFGFVVRAIQNRDTIVIGRFVNPTPKLRVTSSTYKLPTIEGTVNNVAVNDPFSTTITVSEGDSAIKQIDFYLNNEDVLSEQISQVDDEYTLEWENGISVAGDYVLKIVAEDVTGDKSIKELSFRVCGTDEIVSNEVIKTMLDSGNAYNGNAWSNLNSWEANNSSLTAYFSYDLSDYKASGIKSFLWGCPNNTYNQSVKFYETITGWDSESISSGDAPEIASSAFVENTGVTSVDMTEHVNNLLSKGITTLNFAIKTASEETLIIDKSGENAPVVNVIKSDNLRPVISGGLTSEDFITANTSKTINLNVGEDGLVMDVTAIIDDATGCVVSGANDEYSITIPALSAGIHKLEVCAEDNFGIKTVKTYVLNVGAEPVSSHTLTKGATTTAAATGASNNTILLLVAYKDGKMIGVSIDTATTDGASLSASLTLSETPDEYRSFICDSNFKPLKLAE